MSAYVWIIDRDHLAAPTDTDPDNLTAPDDDAPFSDDAGTFGPRDADPALVARLDAGEGRTFKMYDDDDELYYTGRLVAHDDPAEHDLAPLDDYGLPSAGATRIEWESCKTR